MRFLYSAKFPYGEISTRRKFPATNIPGGEYYQRRKFTVVKNPTAKIPAAKIPHTRLSSLSVPEICTSGVDLFGETKN